MWVRVAFRVGGDLRRVAASATEVADGEAAIVLHHADLPVPFHRRDDHRECARLVGCLLACQTLFVDIGRNVAQSRAAILLHRGHIRMLFHGRHDGVDARRRQLLAS